MFDGKPDPRPRAHVIHVPWTLEELSEHIKAMMARKEPDVNESPDVVRADLIEVLNQYPRHMAADDESRRYRERMEALLSDDEVMGGPSPDYLRKSKSHWWAMAEYDITRVLFAIAIAFAFFLALDWFLSLAR